MITIGALLGTILVFQFRPQESETWNGVLAKYRSKAEHWESINSLHTKAMEQAGYDRNLFENASTKRAIVDVSYPEYVNSLSSFFNAVLLVAIANVVNTGLSHPTLSETSRPVTFPTLTTS